MRKLFICLFLVLSTGAYAAKGGSLGNPKAFPGDVVNASGAHVVAAHSTWRSLFKGYGGPLFYTTRTSDSTTKAIYPLPGGMVDMQTLLTFCGGILNPNQCGFTVLCDQVNATCSPNNGAVVTISNGSPSVITWTNSNLALNTKIFFEFQGYLQNNNNLPSGLTPDTIYYVVNPGVSSFNVAATPSGTAINTTTAGTGPFTAFLTGVNDLSGITQATAPEVIFTTLPTGELISAFSNLTHQAMRQRPGTNNIPTNATPASVYTLFGTNNVSVCCGMYGDGEAKLINNGNGHDYLVSVVKSVSVGCLTGPCYSSDNESVSYTTNIYGSVTVTAANPGVVTFTNHGMPNGTPFDFEGTTAPSPLALKTTYYVANAAQNTFQISTTPYGAAVQTTTTGSSLHVAGKPQTAFTGGWLTGIATCDGGTAYTMDWGDEQSPGLDNWMNAMPAGFDCTHHEGGLALGEGGDGSSSAVQWLEGLVSQGVIPPTTREQLIANNYARLNMIGPTSGQAFNFVSGSTPAGWTFSRAACTNQTNCATDAQYSDSAGATYSRFNDGVPVIDSKGLGMFAKRANFVPNSDCTYSPACPFPTGTSTLTVSSLATGKNYKLFCNGTASITPSNGTGTISAGTSALACNGGSWETITMSVTGTIVLTATANGSGNVNWVDVQDDAAANTAAPTPHIITGSTLPVTRNYDQMAIGGTVANWLATGNFSAIVDFTPETISAYNMGANDGNVLGGSVSGRPTMYWNTTTQFIGLNTGDNAFVVSTPTAGVEERLGGTFGPGVGSLGLNGVYYMFDQAGGGAFQDQVSGLTFYLGSDIPLTAACNCWITQAAFYPYILTRPQMVAKSTLGATLP